MRRWCHSCWPAAAPTDAASLGARVNLRKRADVYFGYSRVQDTGGPIRNVSALDAFRLAQSFPMSYDSPQARFSLRLHTKIRWNVGWQYYRYHEDQLATQNYSSHTGYTSVLWSF